MGRARAPARILRPLPAEGKAEPGR